MKGLLLTMKNVWKVLGLAGLAGVAATGVIIARDERRRAQVTPDEVRERLHRRLEDAERSPSDGQTRADGRDSGVSRESARPGGCLGVGRLARVARAARQTGRSRALTSPVS